MLMVLVKYSKVGRCSSSLLAAGRAVWTFPVITSQLHGSEAEGPKLMPIHICFDPSASRPSCVTYIITEIVYCEGRSSRGLVEGILKAPRAAALRPNVMEHSYDGRVGRVSILILNQPCQHFNWGETGVPGENPRLLAER